MLYAGVYTHDTQVVFKARLTVLQSSPVQVHVHVQWSLYFNTKCAYVSGDLKHVKQRLFNMRISSFAP